MSSNSVCNHALGQQITLPGTSRSSDFVNHSYDYRQNWTPLSPINITNNKNTDDENTSAPIDSRSLVYLDVLPEQS